MLLQGSLVAYLLESGFLGAERVVAGDLTIHDASRRNRNFKILQDHGPCFFLKQAIASDAKATIGREADILRFLAAFPGERWLASHVPRVSRYDPACHLLILNMSRHAETLDRALERTRRMPSGVGAMLGRILGTLHRATGSGPARTRCEREWSGQTPWVLGIHRPQVPYLWTASDANLSLVRIIQDHPGIQDGLDALQNSWERECLIHGDLKAENIVLGSAGRKSGLQVIDWELARFGDPAWDVGSVWSDILRLWLLSIPMAQDAAIEKTLELAPFPLKRMAPFATAFWRSYLRERALDGGSADLVLGRSMTFAAARLLQSAFESLTRSNKVTTNVVYLVQLSWNMMRSPHQAASDLLGVTA